MKATALSGKSVYAEAKRKAVYGHRDWLVWTDRDGIQHADRKTYASTKRAMLAVGTQGRFSLIGATDGHSMIIRWRTAVNILHWCKYYEAQY